MRLAVSAAAVLGRPGHLVKSADNDISIAKSLYDGPKTEW